MKGVMNMVNLVYMYEVAPEKQQEYFKVTAELIKPYWESHGCQSYNISQDAEGGTAFLKEMLFPDMESLKKTTRLAETDSEGKAVIQRFKSFAQNASRRIYIQKL
jgi:quinol monooxygenase YgiN